MQKTIGLLLAGAAVGVAVSGVVVSKENKDKAAKVYIEADEGIADTAQAAECFGSVATSLGVSDIDCSKETVNVDGTERLVWRCNGAVLNPDARGTCMAQHLEAKEPGGRWLGVSCSAGAGGALNCNARHALTETEKAEKDAKIKEAVEVKAKE